MKSKSCNKCICTCIVPTKIPGTNIYYTGSYLPYLQIASNTNLNNVLIQLNSILSTIISGLGAQRKDILIGTDKPIGNTLQDDAFIGKTILIVIKNNTPEQNYTFNSTTGTLNFSSIGGLFNDDKLTIIYN